ncbi:hypothetical protein B0O99DRAFT_194969 [Bisporella sp. PMI_857]|nr:hypothetical protein B0O99DRAFT_194969 [Bisporella sp. PMI_857]
MLLVSIIRKTIKQSNNQSSRRQPNNRNMHFQLSTAFALSSLAIAQVTAIAIPRDADSESIAKRDPIIATKSSCSGLALWTNPNCRPYIGPFSRPKDGPAPKVKEPVEGVAKRDPIVAPQIYNSDMKWPLPNCGIAGCRNKRPGTVWPGTVIY